MTKSQALTIANQFMKKSFEFAEQYNSMRYKHNKFARHVDRKAEMAAELAAKYYKRASRIQQ